MGKAHQNDFWGYRWQQCEKICGPLNVRFSPIATILRAVEKCRDGPRTDIGSASFDQLVGRDQFGTVGNAYAMRTNCIGSAS
jgi:hypothetical protein